jgi:hypothetical protein
MTDEYAQEFAASHASLAKVRAKMPRAVKYHADAGGEAPPPVENLSPESTSLPVITGSPMVGGLLSCSEGSWSNAPSSFSFNWRSGVATVGADSPLYTLVDEDIGDMMTCRVTATNAHGSNQVTSGAVGPIVEGV